VVVVVVVVIVDVVVEFFVLDVVELVAVGVVVVGQRVVFVLVDGLELLGRLGLLHRPARRRRERRLTAGPLLRRLARPRWRRSVRAVEPVVDRTGRRDGRKPGRGLLPDRRAVALTGRRRGREALAGALARRNRGEAGAGPGPGRGREILADAFARCRREGSTGALTGRRRGREALAGAFTGRRGREALPRALTRRGRETLAGALTRRLRRREARAGLVPGRRHGGETPSGPVARPWLPQRRHVVGGRAVLRSGGLDVRPGGRRIDRVLRRFGRGGLLRRFRARDLGLGVQLAERVPVALPGLEVDILLVPDACDPLVRRGRRQLAIGRCLLVGRCPRAAATTGTAAGVGLAVPGSELGDSEPPRGLFTVLSTHPSHRA